MQIWSCRRGAVCNLVRLRVRRVLWSSAFINSTLSLPAVGAVDVVVIHYISTHNTSQSSTGAQPVNISTSGNSTEDNIYISRKVIKNSLDKYLNFRRFLDIFLVWGSCALCMFSSIRSKLLNGGQYRQDLNWYCFMFSNGLLYALYQSST